MDDLARIQNGLPTLETMGGATGWNVRGHQLAAFRSLARSRGVDVGYVIAKASEGRLIDVIELRAHHRTFSPARPGMGVRTGDDALAVLAFRRHPQL